MDEIATEGDVLTKFKAAGGSATGVPDSTQCVTKANLTNPAGLPNNMTLTVSGSYNTNELVANPDIAFRNTTKYGTIYFDNETGNCTVLALKISLNGKTIVNTTEDIPYGSWTIEFEYDEYFAGVMFKPGDISLTFKNTSTIHETHEFQFYSYDGTGHDTMIGEKKVNYQETCTFTNSSDIIWDVSKGPFTCNMIENLI